LYSNQENLLFFCPCYTKPCQPIAVAAQLDRKTFTGKIIGYEWVGCMLERSPVPPVRINPDIPSKLDETISKCPEKDRSLRYQHASDVRTDLQRLKRDRETGKSTAVTGISVIPMLKPWWQKRAAITGIAVAILAVVLWLTSIYLYPHKGIDSIAVLPFVNTSGDPNVSTTSAMESPKGHKQLVTNT
jgi:hypothetical protein